MKFIRLATISALSVGMIAGGNIAYADAVTQDDGSVNTDGTVEFREADDDNVETVDPEPGPDEEVTIPPIEGQEGPFAIGHVQDYDFGNRENSALTQNYPAAALWYDIKEDSEWGPANLDDLWVNEDGTEAARAHFAQVRDLREDLSDWTLSVKLDGQFQNADQQELTGAVIHFTDGQALNTSKELPKVATKFNLEPNKSVEIMTSAADEGFGLSTVMWGSKASLVEDEEVEGGLANNSVRLEVPGSTRTSTDSPYTTKLNWSLAATPANEL